MTALETLRSLPSALNIRLLLANCKATLRDTLARTNFITNSNNNNNNDQQHAQLFVTVQHAVDYAQQQAAAAQHHDLDLNTTDDSISSV